MKKFFNYIYAVLLMLSCCITHDMETSPLSQKLSVEQKSTDSRLQNNGILTDQVREIFEKLGFACTTLAQANEHAQKHFIRSGERKDEQPENSIHAIMQQKKLVLMEKLACIGMVDEILPIQKTYTYALVMGSSYYNVLNRLDYLEKLEQQGYSFQAHVLLTGMRPLWDTEKEMLPVDIDTEADMMAYVYKNNSIAQHNKKMILINAPMIKKPDGSLARPTTDSTLLHFAEQVQEDGSCLVISHNPFIERQLKVAQRMLDKARFEVKDGAGSAMKRDMDIVILMDEFARLLYEEYSAFRNKSC